MGTITQGELAEILTEAGHKHHHSFLPWQQSMLAGSSSAYVCVAAMCNNGQPPHTQP